MYAGVGCRGVPVEHFVTGIGIFGNNTGGTGTGFVLFLLPSVRKIPEG